MLMRGTPQHQSTLRKTTPRMAEMIASVVVSKFATFRYRSPSELRNQNDTRNQYVASVLWIPKFAKRRYRDVANFGIGTLAGISRGARHVLFNSYVFLFAFLPVALCGCFILGQIGRSYAAAWLVFVSLIFYGYWSPSFLLILLASVLFNCGMSELIAARASQPVWQSWLLGLAV